MPQDDVNILRQLQWSRYIQFLLPEEIAWLSKPTKFTIDRENSFFEPKSSFLFFSILEFSFEERFSYNSSDVLQNSIQAILVEFLSSYLEINSINTYLNQYSPISEIRFNPNINIYKTQETTIVENLIVDFKVNGDWVPWSFLSDGTKRLFYLISETISLKEGLLLIEEPELGVHPHQLHNILDFLKEQSRNKQIIISTHSPLALDVLNEDELDRIIIAKYEKGSRFNHLTQDQIDTAKRYMNEMGELSYYWLHSDLDV